ncbi:cysteine-rich venom protein 2-like [Anolis sagrei]|uniref:cysteine-rich venom protein 2-like n=1 Tax=Anolis sagrei TaxID=38937 RepID=UPI00352055ED
MLFLIKLLVLAVVIQQSMEQGNSGIVANIPKKRQKEIIDGHNAVRARVNPTASNMMKMRWDEEASETAKKWAAQCRGRTSPADQRLVDGVYCGEIMLTSYKPVSWSKIIEDWSTTSVNFKYGEGPIGDINLSDVYTQLVWHNSHRVGCATAHCPDQIVPFLYVCHYCPL